MSEIKNSDTGAGADTVTLDYFKARKFQLRGVEKDIDLSKGRKLRAKLAKDSHGHPLLTTSLISALCDLILDGCTLANAARVCGVRYNVLERWLEMGKKDVDEEPPRDTLEAALIMELNAAQGDAEAELSSIVRAQCHNDPRLALETLGRRNPHDWAPATPEAADIKGLYGKGMTAADIRKEMKRLLEAGEKKTDDNV